MTSRVSNLPKRKQIPRVIIVLFHPDYTVGLGIKPSLLTLCETRIPLRRSRADGLSPKHRRWGITPRPENVLFSSYSLGIPELQGSSETPSIPLLQQPLHRPTFLDVRPFLFLTRQPRGTRVPTPVPR